MIKILNVDDYNLYCIYSKERIKVGEEYILVVENYCGDPIENAYKLEYEAYIIDEELEEEDLENE